MTDIEITEMKFEWAELEDVGQYMADPEWAFEQKCDGMRLMVRFDEDAQPSFSLRSTAATQWYEALTLTLAGLPGMESAILDGELMTATGEYILFDAPSVPTCGISPATPFASRRRFLESFTSAMWSEPQNVRLVRHEATYEGKKDLYETLFNESGEGVVAKRLQASYTTDGTRSADMIKFKFYKTADCVVTARNEGACNAKLAMYVDRAALTLRPVGGCSMIGKPDAQVGDVIEVKFLGATKDLILYQPTMLKIRFDKKAEACTIDQLTPMNKRVL